MNQLWFLKNSKLFTKDFRGWKRECDLSIVYIRRTLFIISINCFPRNQKRFAFSLCICSKTSLIRIQICLQLKNRSSNSSPSYFFIYLFGLHSTNSYIMFYRNNMHKSTVNLICTIFLCKVNQTEDGRISFENENIYLVYAFYFILK